MAVRESFLTVTENLAAAPGPGHYSPTLGPRMGSDRGRGSLHNKVSSMSVVIIGFTNECSPNTHIIHV